MQTIKPPNFKEILARHFEDITQLQAHATPIDDKGRYLPWPEFRYRYQRPEIEWAAVKIARQEIMADYQISENSARTDLKGLANIGVLTEAQHKGRLKIYIAMPDIESRLTGKKR